MHHLHRLRGKAVAMNDDLVQRKRGRPFRKCSLQETMSPGVSRANGKRCPAYPSASTASLAARMISSSAASNE